MPAVLINPAGVDGVDDVILGLSWRTSYLGVRRILNRYVALQNVALRLVAEACLYRILETLCLCPTFRSPLSSQV